MITITPLTNLENLATIFSQINLNNRQQEYLTDFITRYNQKTKKSKKIAQANRSILADNKSFVDFQLPLKELYYPLVTQQSYGSKIHDVDGNEYIDLVMGYGVNLFGHNPDFIKKAIIEQLNKGIQLGSQPELIGEVANLISELTGVERVAFSNTGTEAVMTAIRLARTVTGRNKIVMFSNSYHGHFDGTLGKPKTINNQSKTVAIASGIPTSYLQDTLVLKYGDEQSLEIIKQNSQEIAAVLVEPVQSSQLNLQPKTFLQQLRQLTQDLKIALIFDEMVTGFRIHPGGAQAWFEIEADLVTYGKIVGGGLPIGIIAGKAQYLDAINGGIWHYGDLSSPQSKTTFFAGTYCKHPLAIASAHAVLVHLKTQGATLQEQLNQRTSNFVATLNDYFEQEELPIYLANFGSLFGSSDLEIDESAEDNSELSLVFDLLYYHLLAKGIMLRGNGGFLSTAHTDADINYIIQAVKDSISELKEGEFLP
ncbi:Glutamate-1-semialdehyde 2,1-aminomutase [Stanieria cyanosphaera PCC 7437]|uniref:Glutamate-1-semialdehyde 2,1-aminomutase n=1 Tax=Stanieria cyanosphaera (strain ATCC 29371 / PCC 7437) TaxID=111780 RepID=K9XVT0_STAC7|nr:aspartate aminotransferase family protein [Stanieria cyanosphaera]AFZ36191.1 Glutamate-1-semialdehyde 2,1-aminomutase [Stanieria cyanosphaera PCC 7437]